MQYGGSYGRPEATGYGCTWFAEEMIKARGDKDAFKGKIVAISGSGNVAQYTAEKVLDLGGKVITFSDSAEIPISKDVDKVLQQITYANSAGSPPTVPRHGVLTAPEPRVRRHRMSPVVGARAITSPRWTLPVPL